jgi:hypothetical protein
MSFLIGYKILKCDLFKSRKRRNFSNDDCEIIEPNETQNNTQNYTGANNHTQQECKYQKI